mmetsp:Transcript_64395/g.199438  ORF Transcript_64395/g.199438 Transcript_64395/m.199438 type:complete len:143 (+) Transcript_64395:110-538(+)
MARCAASALLLAFGLTATPGAAVDLSGHILDGASQEVQQRGQGSGFSRFLRFLSVPPPKHLRRSEGARAEAPARRVLADRAFGRRARRARGAEPAEASAPDLDLAAGGAAADAAAGEAQAFLYPTKSAKTWEAQSLAMELPH